MGESKIDCRTRVVLVKLAWGKGAVRRPKVMFLSYSAKAPLIQFTRLGPFRGFPQLEGFSGIMVEKT